VRREIRKICSPPPKIEEIMSDATLPMTHFTRYPHGECAKSNQESWWGKPRPQVDAGRRSNTPSKTISTCLSGQFFTIKLVLYPTSGRNAKVTHTHNAKQGLGASGRLRRQGVCTPWRGSHSRVSLHASVTPPFVSRTAPHTKERERGLSRPLHLRGSGVSSLAAVPLLVASQLNRDDDAQQLLGCFYIRQQALK